MNHRRPKSEHALRHDERQQADPLPKEEHEGKLLLLVDDCEDLCTTLSDALTFEGFKVVCTYSGEMALRQLAAVTPDLIILDVTMPGMGGLGFLTRIVDSAGIPKWPVLIFTARYTMEAFFSETSVDGFLPKPCDLDTLLLEIHRILFARRRAPTLLGGSSCGVAHVARVDGSSNEGINKTGA